MIEESKKNEVGTCVFCSKKFIIKDKYQAVCLDCFYMHEKPKHDDMMDASKYVIESYNGETWKEKTMLFDEDVSIDFDLIEELEKL